MKNSKLYSVAAACLAVAMVVASPLTAHAAELDNGFHGLDGGSECNGDGWCGESIFDNASSYEEPSYEEPSYEEPSYDSGFHGTDGGSECDGDGWGGESIYDSSNTSSSSSSSASSSVSTAPAVKKNANDVTMSITGGQKFRVVMNKEHTTYQVYHCGISKATFAVTDADGNAVKYSNIKLEQGEDKLWYANITFAEGVDTTDYVVTATKGNPGYLSTTLGVSGIKVNGVLALSTLS